MLESLDEEIKHRRQIQTDLELAKADREQLLNHFERERELRRRAEERHLNVEDELDLDKSALRSKLEELEGKMRYLDSRAQNYDDISRKAAENEDTLRSKYADLAKRHDETLQKYMNMAEENRSLRKMSNQATPVKEQKVFKKLIKFLNYYLKAPMRVTKQAPSTEVYNITIEGSEHSFNEQQQPQLEQTERDQYHQSSAVSFNQELKSKTGSDSSSEVPDDVKGMLHIN